MLTASFWAWSAYIIGSLGLLCVAWRLTRGLSREWRHLLLVSAAALLLTPGGMSVDGELVLAPALFVLVLDGLFEGLAAASQAGLTLLGVWLVALLASLVFQLLVRPRAKQRHG